MAPRSPDSISPATLARVLERLGLSGAPRADLGGLRALYRAWCRSVPFDNMQKIIALKEAPAGPLPGESAEDFFDLFLTHGTGATCWPSARAMHALLDALRFSARRAAGSMLDGGDLNHGTNRVTLDAREWLVDTSILSDDPLPLDADVFNNFNPVQPIEVEYTGPHQPGPGGGGPAQPGGHVIWWYTPAFEPSMPCRLLADHVGEPLFRERYEASRSVGPFNHRLYARRNFDGEMLVIVGSDLFSRTAGRVDRATLSREQLLSTLRDRFGYSPAVISRWASCGGLDACFEPSAAPPGPPPRQFGLPPSRRGGAPARTA
ncbi:MAG: hypothetical protein AB7G11_03965 [Phycisphaerales bacterium]